MKKTSYLLVVFVVLTITACKSTILMPQYPNQDIAQYGQNKSTLESVEKSIVKAAISLGWKAEKQTDGEIKATLNIRKHQLIILIKYDDNSFSIDYVDSTNLKKKGNKIHRQYANWVGNLIRAINVQNISSS